tara:strand:+ start:6517 stop:6717 length:201 start_codon:yes stop_codon:yes gene_type:complete
MWISVCAFRLIISKFLDPGINIASSNIVLACLLGNMFIGMTQLKGCAKLSLPCKIASIASPAVVLA